MEKLDYKKTFKDLYLPKTHPMVIDVPPISFVMIEGKGNPNIEDGEYQQAVELLYGITYTIKMSKMGKNKPEDYFEYVVPPLEGLWWIEDQNSRDFSDKDKYCWISMIRQPEFVTPQLFDWAGRELVRKKPHLDPSKLYFKIWEEGLCVQMMHIGPYEEEHHTLAQMEAFMEKNQLQNAIGERLPDGTFRQHHEIYLGDPRKSAPAKRKTVLRHPVKR